MYLLTPREESQILDTEMHPHWRRLTQNQTQGSYLVHITTHLAKRDP